jgi:suppressor for copper-sensitivity B
VFFHAPLTGSFLGVFTRRRHMRSMDMIPDRRRFLAQGCLAVLAPCLDPGPVAAQAAMEDASAWSGAPQSRVRLIAGGASTERAGALRAGVEIRLSPGYKTYWRSPGDSGVPPQFNWSGSQNLASIEVRWPAPLRFADGAGSSIGYAEEVIFPLLVTAVDPSQPVILKLALDYAVCEKLCIPAQGSASLQIGPDRTRQIARIAAFEARAPRRIARGETYSGVGLTSATAAREGKGRILRLAVVATESAPLEDVFVEGPDMWLFGKPALTQIGNGAWKAELPLVDRPAMASGMTELLITLVAGPAGARIATETALALDFDTA